MTDALYSASHGAASLNTQLVPIASVHKQDISVIRVPLNAGTEFYDKLDLRSPAGFLLTPILAPDAPAIARLYPSARIGIIGAPAAAAKGRISVIEFDDADAMTRVGEHLATFAAAKAVQRSSGEQQLPVRVEVLFTTENEVERTNLAAFRRGATAHADPGVRFQYVTFTTVPTRDQVREIILRGKGAVAFAFFTGSMDAYCMELVAGDSAKVALSGSAAIEAYPDQLLCTVEEPLATAVDAFLSETGQVIHARAQVVCPSYSTIR
jgi:hypothetical protein